MKSTGALNSQRKNPEEWHAVWLDDRPWLKGKALEIAVMLGLQLRPGDHIVLGKDVKPKGKRGVPGEHCIVEFYDTESEKWLCRHGPGPHHDWGTFITVNEIKAYRPRKEEA